MLLGWKNLRREKREGIEEGKKQEERLHFAGGEGERDVGCILRSLIISLDIPAEKHGGTAA